jgi:hypothetical protein
MSKMFVLCLLSSVVSKTEYRTLRENLSTNCIP